MAKTEKDPLEKIGALFDAIVKKADNKQDMEDDISTVERQLGYFPEYLEAWNNDVVSAAANSRLLAAGYLDTTEFQERRQRTDEMRRVTHDAMLGACSQLNRFCEFYGVEKFCPDPKSMDRSEVARFAGLFVCETCGIDLKEKTLDMYIYNSAEHPEETPQLNTKDMVAEFDRYIESVKNRSDDRVTDGQPERDEVEL